MSFDQLNRVSYKTKKVLVIVADFSNTVAMFRVKPNSHD